MLMVRKEHRQMISFVVSNLFEIINQFIVIRNIPSMPQMDLWLYYLQFFHKHIYSQP